MIKIRNKKLKSKEIKILCRQMGGMLQSGCDIISILDTIIYSSSDHISHTVRKIKKSIEEGKSITEAFVESNMFPKFFIKVLYAGERSGNTGEIFQKLADYYDREEKIRAKLFSASIYPIMLFVVSFIAVNFILIFVVGNFRMAFSMEEMELPKSTTVVFFISDFLKNNALYVYSILALTIYYFIKICSEDKEARMWLDKSKITAPIYGNLMKTAISEKFSRVLLILIYGGINITEALEIASSVINNIYAEKKLREAIKFVESGESVSSSLDKTHIFSKVFISMLKSGEESGRFDSSLESAGKFFREELDMDIEKFIKILEPALIAIMGLLIGITMVSLLYPMVSIISGIE